MVRHPAGGAARRNREDYTKLHRAPQSGFPNPDTGSNLLIPVKQVHGPAAGLTNQSGKFDPEPPSRLEIWFLRQRLSVSETFHPSCESQSMLARGLF